MGRWRKGDGDGDGAIGDFPVRWDLKISCCSGRQVGVSLVSGCKTGGLRIEVQSE